MEGIAVESIMDHACDVVHADTGVLERSFDGLDEHGSEVSENRAASEPLTAAVFQSLVEIQHASHRQARRKQCFTAAVAVFEFWVGDRIDSKQPSEPTPLRQHHRTTTI
ncbi:hypothetical protein, partial [Nocardia pneumoniae]|uniref:hypothetical protein n=1 Tax=Nocardia pneumoniae TaxID=228601 RepID=UPI001FE0A1ED